MGLYLGDVDIGLLDEIRIFHDRMTRFGIEEEFPYILGSLHIPVVGQTPASSQRCSSSEWWDSPERLAIRVHIDPQRRRTILHESHDLRKELVDLVDPHLKHDAGRGLPLVLSTLLLDLSRDCQKSEHLLLFMKG